MQDFTPILERMHRVRAGLLSAANALPAECWRASPRPGAWSAAEVIAHLTMVETAITDGAARLLRAPPHPVPLWKRLHLPPRLAEWRGVRRESPIPLDRSLVTDREAMLSRLAEVRQRTVAFLAEHAQDDLSRYRWRHPFFGSLNFYDWFRVLAYHEARHTQQIREIVETAKL